MNSIGNAFVLDDKGDVKLMGCEESKTRHRFCGGRHRLKG